MVLDTCLAAKSEKVPSTTGHPVRRHRCLCIFGNSNSPTLYFTIICDLLLSLWCGFCNRHLKIPTNSSHCFITLPYVLSPDPLRPYHIWREWSAMIIGSKEHWEIYFSSMIAFQPQVPNGETLFQRGEFCLIGAPPLLVEHGSRFPYLAISINCPTCGFNRVVSLLCEIFASRRTSIFVLLSLENYEQNQYKVSTLEREWAA